MPEWRLVSDRAGWLELPRPVDKLPAGAVVSTDGLWAELIADGTTTAVYMRMGLADPPKGSRRVRRGLGPRPVRPRSYTPRRDYEGGS